MKSTQNVENIKSKQNLLERQEYLSRKIETLTNLCDTLNPYATLSFEEELILKKYNIVEIDNPFVITNKLIMELEDAIEEMEKLKGLTI